MTAHVVNNAKGPISVQEECRGGGCFRSDLLVLEAAILFLESGIPDTRALKALGRGPGDNLNLKNMIFAGSLSVLCIS